MNHLTRIAILGTLLAGLSGCDEPEPEPEELIRAIKTIAVTERAGGTTRSFSGTVQAAKTSDLSFEVGGNLATLLVEAGDAVQRGDVLASLNRDRFELSVEAAEANVARAAAADEEQRNELSRQERLYAKDFVSEAALQSAKSGAEKANNELKYAHSELNLALRDLEKTELRAPYDGVISERKREPYEEVAHGQPVYAIYASEAMEVQVNVPETTVKALALGMPATITLPSAEEVLEGEISEIGTATQSGNTYPIKVALSGGGEGLLPGMTASVAISLDLGGTDGFLVPLSAIVPGERKGEGFTFRYDEASSTLERVALTGVGVRDDMVVITDGISAGDVIAVAGVSFLRDGQKVKLLRP